MKKTGGKLKKFRGDEEGITLVALVITIIIIIILATVTINMAFGDNGLITQAQLAKDMTSNSVVAEQDGMNSLMDEYANVMAEDGEINEVTNPSLDVQVIETSNSSSQLGYIMGETSGFKIEVENNGEVTLKNITLDIVIKRTDGSIAASSLDSGIGDEDYIEKLNIGETKNITFSVTFAGSDFYYENLVIEVNAIGKTDDGKEKTISDTSSTSIDLMYKYQANITVTIKNMDNNNNPINTQGFETYVSVFEDEDLNQLLYSKQITFKNNTSNTTDNFSIELDEGLSKLYVAETDESGSVIIDGIVFNNGFATSEKKTVNISKEQNNINVTIENKFLILP